MESRRRDRYKTYAGELTTRICTLALGISLMSIGINAKVHTWIPLAQAQGLAPQAPVIIIGHISWGSGYFDDSIF